MRALSPAVLLAVLLGGCAPKTILSTQTVQKEPSRVYGQLAPALRDVGYTCEDGTDDHSFTARCRGKHGGITIEVKRKSERPILALRFWSKQRLCGSPAFTARVETFNLRDASGGTRAYCLEDTLVVGFETYLPTQGIEASELGALVVRWEQSAGGAAERFGLFAEPEGEAEGPAGGHPID